METLKNMSYMDTMVLLLEIKNEGGYIGGEAWNIMQDIHYTGVWLYWDDMLVVDGKERPWAYFDPKETVDDEKAMLAAKAHLEQYTAEEIKDMQGTFMRMMVRCLGIKKIYETMKGAEQK